MGLTESQLEVEFNGGSTDLILSKGHRQDVNPKGLAIVQGVVGFAADGGGLGVQSPGLEHVQAKVLASLLEELRDRRGTDHGGDAVPIDSRAPCANFPRSQMRGQPARKRDAEPNGQVHVCRQTGAGRRDGDIRWAALRELPMWQRNTEVGELE